MIHLYIGDGKGKTTAAFGLALRACGWGKKVYIAQMFKDYHRCYGESAALKSYGIPIRIQRFKNQIHPMFSTGVFDAAAVKKSIEASLKTINKIVHSGKYDLVIVDEILNVLSAGFTTLEKVIFLMKNAKNIELVLTGRKAPNEIIALADYVSNIEKMKHPFDKKILARKGIEF